MTGLHAEEASWTGQLQSLQKNLDGSQAVVSQLRRELAEKDGKLQAFGVEVGEALNAMKSAQTERDAVVFQFNDASDKADNLQHDKSKLKEELQRSQRHKQEAQEYVSLTTSFANFTIARNWIGDV